MRVHACMCVCVSVQEEKVDLKDLSDKFGKREWGKPAFFKRRFLCCVSERQNVDHGPGNVT